MTEQPETQKYIWKELFELKVLHGELASLYRMKSTDRRTISQLWYAIEAKEALLFIEGVDVR